MAARNTTAKTAAKTDDKTEAEKNAEEVATDLVANDGSAEVVESAAVATRAAEHDNTADKALVEALTAKDVDPAALKAEIDRLRTELAAVQAKDKDAGKAKGEGISPEKAVTFWVADPRSQVRLWNEEKQEFMRFRGGKYVATSDQEADLIRKHLAGTAFEQDREKAHAPHPITGYAPLSDAAYDAHLELVTRA